MVADHEHIQVFIDGVHCEGAGWVGRRGQDIGHTHYLHDVRGVASSCTLRVIGVDGAALEKVRMIKNSVKGKDQFWSCDCIVKETLWNRSEKVDHLAYKYKCVLQGSGIIKMIRNLDRLGKVTSTVHRKMYMGLHDIYPWSPNRYNN